MKFSMDQIPSAWKRSPPRSRVRRSSCCRLYTLLPAGFEEVDVAILDWIAAEARRMRRSLSLMQLALGAGSGRSIVAIQRGGLAAA